MPAPRFPSPSKVNRNETAKMVRQKPRKSIEELYGTKFDNSPLKTHIPTNLSTAKTARNEPNYMISTNMGYGNNATSGCQTGRRKTARPISKPDKFPTGKEERFCGGEDSKKDHNAKKTARACYPTANNSNMNAFDNKMNESNQRSHHHHYNSMDEEKDDDTEEFFQLIRQTVENAIGKSFSDVLNRNFRELSSKIDRFSSELKTTNALLGKLQTEVSNKVVHYGEENSRHFRYLCMKSEYDKMFYQHHTMMATGKPTGSPSSEKRMAVSKVNMPTEKPVNPCKCRTGTSKLLNTEPHKTSSEERSISNKSSEMGMREVLEQIQRFCNQMQLSDLKGEERPSKGMTTYRTETELKLKQFEDDDDEFQLSSDGMTPRSDEGTLQSYGGSSKRGCTTARTPQTSGGGDA